MLKKLVLSLVLIGFLSSSVEPQALSRRNVMYGLVAVSAVTIIPPLVMVVWVKYVLKKLEKELDKIIATEFSTSAEKDEAIAIWRNRFVEAFQTYRLFSNEFEENVFRAADMMILNAKRVAWGRNFNNQMRSLIKKKVAEFSTVEEKDAAIATFCMEYAEACVALRGGTKEDHLDKLKTRIAKLAPSCGLTVDEANLLLMALHGNGRAYATLIEQADEMQQTLIVPDASKIKDIEANIAE